MFRKLEKYLVIGLEYASIYFPMFVY